MRLSGSLQTLTSMGVSLFKKSLANEPSQVRRSAYAHTATGASDNTTGRRASARPASERAEVPTGPATRRLGGQSAFRAPANLHRSCRDEERNCRIASPARSAVGRVDACEDLVADNGFDADRATGGRNHSHARRARTLRRGAKGRAVGRVAEGACRTRPGKRDADIDRRGSAFRMPRPGPGDRTPLSSN